MMVDEEVLCMILASEFLIFAGSRTWAMFAASVLWIL
jgi:hypothetical protein